ncbi:MAG TPA: SRPBCC domain-containing protein [Candidatus Limnocylindrales bacterium]|nr:SRPBCC domain-containing protein [Candidatus Limnocylindrales bacterium]
MEPTSFSHFRSFKSPVTAIWPCLTIPDRLGGWLGEADFDLAREGPILVKTRNGDVFEGRVMAAVPPARLEFAWRPFNFDPPSHVTWRLSGDGPGSRLTVTHDGLRSREERDHARLFWRESLDALARFADLSVPSSEWGGTHPVTIRAFMPRPAGDLWPLLSTAAGLAKWVANVEQFEAQPGSAFRFRSRYRGQDVVEQGVVQEIVPESKLKLSWDWVGEGWTAPTELLFALEPEEGGTSVLISHSGFDRIEPAAGLAARRNYATAWAEVLADLKQLLTPAGVR